MNEAEKLVWKAVAKRRLPRLDLIAKHELTDEQVAVMVDAAWPDEATALRVLAAFVYVQRQREEHHCLTLPTAYQRKKARAYEIERFGLATVLERDEEARLRAYPPVACNLPAYDEPRTRTPPGGITLDADS